MRQNQSIVVHEKKNGSCNKNDDIIKMLVSDMYASVSESIIAT